MGIRLIHVPTGRVLAERLEIARSPVARMRGLIGRRNLPRGFGMFIGQCASIHTFFMKFPIDVLFLSADLRVRKVVRHLPPWRLAGAWGATHVVELAAGMLDSLHVAAGDTVRLEETR